MSILNLTVFDILHVLYNIYLNCPALLAVWPQKNQTFCYPFFQSVYKIIFILPVLTVHQCKALSIYHQSVINFLETKHLAHYLPVQNTKSPSLLTFVYMCASLEFYQGKNINM